MAKKNIEAGKSVLVFNVDPTECPFREFRDNELQPDLWGLGPAACRAAALLISKTSPKPSADYVWIDEQTQPLPRSVRQFLHGWVRAEELALRRWEAEVVVFEDTNSGKISVIDMQLSYAQVLLRSSFCRKVLSACYILERVEGLIVEHQWENFIFSMGPEGWRAKHHIYSPGMKPGGGQQHRPGLSKSGCYLVRLFYLGAWRCVWVNDQVPLDATDSPLLPFSPLISQVLPVKPGGEQVPVTVTAKVVHLWPLLLCKALLKLAAPDMNSDEEFDCIEDEVMPEFNIIHSLTGAMNMRYKFDNPEDLWKQIIAEVPLFSWDDDDDTIASTVKSKTSKKPATKEAAVVKRSSFSYIIIADTKNLPPYAVPGITPGHEMSLIVNMARDLPLKKPLPEPEVPLWKHYRWVDWARSHGLYDAYHCPRTKFLKINGLMKLSYAPHLLDVQSTESIFVGFKEEHKRLNPPLKKTGKDLNRSNTAMSAAYQQIKEELREWIQFESLQALVKEINVIHYPSAYQLTSAASNPPIRVTKGLPNKAIDMCAPKSAPLYLQIDGLNVNTLRISLSVLHPRLLFNSGVPVVDYIEPAYLFVESFEWFTDCKLPVTKAFLNTRGYDSVEMDFQPGRHFCRIWVHSRMHWHLTLLSKSTLLLGTRDIIQVAAVRECPWASRFLLNLGTAFTNWIRINRSNTCILATDREFYKSYAPDLPWKENLVGYKKSLLHWMFRQALQSFLVKKLQAVEYHSVCAILRRYFCDPDFGLPVKPKPLKSFREIVALDLCNCLMPESEELEILEERLDEQITEDKLILDQFGLNHWLNKSIEREISLVCKLATKEVPCGILKDQREKFIKRHEAATYIQAHWRGTWARKCLTARVNVTPEIFKIIMDNVFGNLEALSALMNEFFLMYPGAKYAYSVASALSGVYGLQQFNGSTQITPKCKWVPYFQGVFYCHGHVKVHLDLQSTSQYSTLAIYNNDTEEQLPQVFGAHITFNVAPNIYGYTVMGHGTLKEPSGVYHDYHWQLTVLSSIKEYFHLCDNNLDQCKEITLPSVYKFHIDEIFLPNRKKILGGIQISVMKHEAVSFRAASTSPDLEMVAILRTTTKNGDIQEIARSIGTGEIYWPYIRLEQAPPQESTSQANLPGTLREIAIPSARSLKGTPKSAKSSVGKSKSMTKIKSVAIEPKQYFIEVITPCGWPLTVAQWIRVNEVRNSLENKTELQAKKPNKEKVGSGREKDKISSPMTIQYPQTGDAYVELECSVTSGGSAVARRDDERDLQFVAARREWDAYEPGRNLRGSQIRKEFRAEFLEAITQSLSESAHSYTEEQLSVGMENEEERKDQQLITRQGPTPATESELLEMTVESEEESKYITMPEQIRDKFIPLYFLPFCMREKEEDLSVLVTPDMAKAGKKNRQIRTEAALQRMRELQRYNEEHVLGRQQIRCQLLEKLFVDYKWSQNLQNVLEQRDDAIAQETLKRNLSLTKKKQDTTKKKLDTAKKKQDTKKK